MTSEAACVAPVAINKYIYAFRRADEVAGSPADPESGALLLYLVLVQTTDHKVDD